MMPRHHDVRPSDVLLRRMRGDARGRRRARADRLRRSVDDAGPRRAHRRGARRRSPRWCTARRAASPIRRASALAHGGKDGHPVPGAAARLRSDDRASCGAPSTRPSSATTSGWRRSGGSTPKRGAWKSIAEAPTFEEYVAENLARSDEYGGRTVFDDNNGAKMPKAAQLELFTTTADRPAAPAPTRRPAPHPTAAAPSSRRATRESA